MPRGQSYRDVHVDRPLSNLSISHFQDTSTFVSGRFFNNLSVSNASDTYTVYPQGYFNRKHNSKRAEDGIANSIQYGSREESYSCDEDALRIFISDKKRANADGHRNLDFEATEVVTNALLIGREQEFTTKFLTASAGWSIDKLGVSGAPGAGEVQQWNEAGADPVAQVLADHEAGLLLSSGKKYNKALMTYDVWRTLRERADIIERVNASSSNNNPAIVTMQAIAALFELDEIMIMQSVINSAADGIEDVDGNPPVTNTFMASGVFLMAHVAPGAGLYTATSGLTFLWNQYISHGLDAGPAIRRYRPQNGQKGEYIEGELCMDQKIVAGDLGCLYTNLVA